MQSESKRKLTYEQKISFVLLLVFGCLALGLGALRIRNTMYKPFALSNAIPVTISNLADNINSLQYRDTDFDGLNDFEEKYIYQTSMYLADSDSDGIDDKTEVSRGNNPLCPSGKNCSGNLVSVSGLQQNSTSTILGNSIKAPEQKPEDLNKLLNDPKKLRSALLSAGVDSKVLDQVTDDQLLFIVSEAIPSSTSFNNIAVPTP